jgi:twitching motility protein PilT
MHVGEKPYVVTATGHAELAAKALTIPAMTAMLDQLLPADSRHALDELGAVEFHLPTQTDSAPELSYSVVAARGGDDIWIELRRRKAEPAPVVPVVKAEPAPAIPVAKAEPPPAIPVAKAEPDTFTIETSGPGLATLQPEPKAEPLAVADPEPVYSLEPVGETELAPAFPESEDLVTDDESHFLLIPDAASAFEPTGHDDAAVAPEDITRVASDIEAGAALSTRDSDPAPGTIDDESDVITLHESTTSDIEDWINSVVAVDERPAPIVKQPAEEPTEPAVAAGLKESLAEGPAPLAPTPQEIEALEPNPRAGDEEPVVLFAGAGIPADEITPAEEPNAAAVPEPAALPVPPQRAAIVAMPARGPVRPEGAGTASVPRGEGLPHLLQVAAAHGASVLYVAVQAKPSLRVDGEIRVLEQETPLGEALLEEGLRTILPKPCVGEGEVETCDVPGVGRVQCLRFRDHRGLGAMFKMLPARAISSEQMGLGAPIQSLCTETEGLVLVAGGRGAGKSTLVAALVDQINRTRRDHVITVEQQIQYVHENRQSFVSQREARDDETFVDAVRAALREGPDVLVIDQVASSEAATFALNAAAGGHLVIASITASTTPGALSRFMEFFGEDRTDARLTVSEHLRGVIAQSLLRKTGGGRAAAREVLVNVPSVAALVAGGEFEQLGSVLNGGRRVGMVPLNDALLSLVQSGALDVREAYRKSPDQQEFVGQLNRVGVDTTFAERLA